jgi:hypothetical protein
MNAGAFALPDSLETRGWSFVKHNNFRLRTGKHALTIACRENRTQLDKVCIWNDRYSPEGMSENEQRT